MILENTITAYIKALLQRFNAVFLAGEVSSSVAVLTGNEEHLRIALLPHLAVRLHRQLTVTHSRLHVLHLLAEQRSRLQVKQDFDRIRFRLHIKQYHKCSMHKI